MNKPFYELNCETKNIILELKKKCQELDLGNVAFSYFMPHEINFYITQYKDYWELVVKQERKDNCGIYCIFTDIYRIVEDNINYESSERDIV